MESPREPGLTAHLLLPCQLGKWMDPVIFNGNIKGTSLERQQIPGKMILKVPSISYF